MEKTGIIEEWYKMDMMPEKTLYEQLQLRKENGEELDFYKITYEILKCLWWDELCSDRVIAELYNVSKYRVSKKRYEYGMNLYEMVAEEAAKDYVNYLRQKDNKNI